MKKYIIIIMIISIITIAMCKNKYSTFDFREVAWYMSPSEVIQSEKNDFPNIKYDNENKLIYFDKFGCVVGFPYEKDDTAYYRFTNDNKFAVVNVFIYSGQFLEIKRTERMKQLKELLIKKYGIPKENMTENGILYIWENDNTIITEALNEFYLTGTKENKIHEYIISYESKKLLPQYKSDIEKRRKEKNIKFNKNY